MNGGKIMDKISEAAKKIWDICKESPEMGNAVMDVIGEQSYKRVMDIIKEQEEADKYYILEKFDETSLNALDRYDHDRNEHYVEYVLTHLGYSIEKGFDIRYSDVLKEFDITNENYAINFKVKRILAIYDPTDKHYDIRIYIDMDWLKEIGASADNILDNNPLISISETINKED